MQKDSCYGISSGASTRSCCASFPLNPPGGALMRQGIKILQKKGADLFISRFTIKRKHYLKGTEGLNTAEEFYGSIGGQSCIVVQN